MARFCFFLLAVFLLFPLPRFSSAVQRYPDCKICHKYMDTAKVVHPPVTESCVSCHTEPHRKEQKHAKGLAKEETELCFGCHNKAAFEGRYMHAPTRAESPIGACSRCHNPHSSENAKLLREKIPALCHLCHRKEKFAGASVHAPVSSGECTSCHFPHHSETEGLLREYVPALCFRCHSSAGFERRQRHAVAATGRCLLCHNPHASDAISLLILPGNELCVACHDGIHVTLGMPLHPVTGEKDPLREGREFGCTSCHTPHSAESGALFLYKAGSTEEFCRYCHKG